MRDKYITKKTCVETDWVTELNEPYNVFELLEGGEASGWETHDPGFHQPSYSNEELNDVADLSNLSDQSDDSNGKISNSFILNEPEENPDKSTSSSDSANLANISKRRKKPANVKKNLFNESKIFVSRNPEQVIENVSENEESPVISIKRTRAFIDDSDTDQW